MLRPWKQRAAVAGSGPRRGMLWDIVPEVCSQHNTPPPDPSSGAPLTWGQVCTEGPVDKGEVQHDG